MAASLPADSIRGRAEYWPLAGSSSSSSYRLRWGSHAQDAAKTVNARSSLPRLRAQSQRLPRLATLGRYRTRPEMMSWQATRDVVQRGRIRGRNLSFFLAGKSGWCASRSSRGCSLCCHLIGAINGASAAMSLHPGVPAEMPGAASARSEGNLCLCPTARSAWLSAAYRAVL